MANAVTDEERPSADFGKRRKFPILTRSTLWLVILLLTLALIGIVAGLLVPIAIRQRVGPLAETRALLSSLGLAVEAYGQEYGHLPSSVNLDLAKELTGQNAKGIPFIVFRPRSLSVGGEVVDSWQMPLRFVWADGRSAQIISAGPDLMFGTADDIKWPEDR